MSPDTTIIPVKFETRDRLRALKREGETYDRLLDRALRPLERRMDRRILASKGAPGTGEVQE